MRASIRLRFEALAIASLLVSLVGCTSPERCAIGSAGCVCDATDACDSGLTCTTDRRCEPAANVVCYDACRWNFDGACDDGGPGSEYSVCAYGSDCTDCLGRTNTCTDPDYPVYCPNTASTAGGPCWSPNTDCDSIVTCTDGEVYGCTSGLRWDCATMACVTNSCAGNGWNRTYCDADPSQCFASLTDCSTVISCDGTYQGCFVGETSACSMTSTFSCN